MIKELDDYFEYDGLDLEFTENEVKENFESLSLKCSEFTKQWSEKLNSEWVARDYIAVKMILSSSV